MLVELIWQTRCQSDASILHVTKHSVQHKLHGLNYQHGCHDWTYFYRIYLEKILQSACEMWTIYLAMWGEKATNLWDIQNVQICV